MELTEIATTDQWLALEEEIYDRSGLEANVFNTDGIRITGHKKWVNRLCPEIKADDRGQSFICAVAHMNLATQARNSKQAVIEECDAGLIKMVLPIFYKDVYVGAVGACGLLLDDGEVDAFMINKTIGMDEERIAELTEGIPRVPKERLEELAGVICQKLDAILKD